MFSSGQGFWWSPKGRYLAYIESDDTEVQQIEYTWFGDGQYPSTVSVPYPKVCHLPALTTTSNVKLNCAEVIHIIVVLVHEQPGTPNPVVKVFVVDTENIGKVTQVHVPTLFQNM